MEQTTTINDLLFELNMKQLRRKYQFWVLTGLILFFLSGLVFLALLVESGSSYFGLVFLVYGLPYFVASILLLIGGYLMREDYQRLKRMRSLLYPDQGGYGGYGGYGGQGMYVDSERSYSRPPPPPP